MSTTPDPDRGDTTVALAGDWHSNHNWTDLVLRVLAAQGIKTVYHLGDYGIWPDKDNRSWYLERVENLCEKYDINVWVTPGNHENWRWIDGIFRERGSRPQSLVINGRRQFVLPRGYRWSHAERTLVALGGAPSVDYPLRTANHDWFPEEMIPEQVAQQVAAAGHAEIMLAHDIPNLDVPVIHHLLRRNPHGWPAKSITYAETGRKRLDIAHAGVSPRLYAHGHYHIQGDTILGNGERVLSLSQDGLGGNVAIVDLADIGFGVEWPEVRYGDTPERRALLESYDRFKDKGWAQYGTTDA